MNTFFGKTLITLSLLVAGAAQAGPIGKDSGTIGNATVNDVTLGGIAANYISYASGVNPQAGENGSSAGFDSAFASSGTGSWTSIAKFTASPDGASASATLGASVLTVFFDQNTDSVHDGIWRFTNADAENDVQLDLVFAMHTGGGSGAWLFNDKVATAGSTVEGTWAQHMFNKGGEEGGFSNLTVFTRNFVATPKRGTNTVLPSGTPSTGGGSNIETGSGGGNVSAEVPEPSSIAGMMLGLGMLGLARRRKRTR